jgi:hypothetical protein
MKKPKLVHAAKYYLKNYECGMCETGVVQIHQKWARGGSVTTLVSGCLDCGHEYGVRQSQALNPYTRDDITWP